jgi:uncharacterized phage-associated protein
MSYLRLLKLLYIADRESLKETGRSITGDHVVAMEHGPVLGGVYSLIKGEHTAWAQWSAFFRKNGYRLEMVNDPGNGKLSKYELGKLRGVADAYADKDEWSLVEVVHGFEEWKKNDPGKSSQPIPLEDILEAIGRAGDKEQILQDARDDTAFQRLFSEEVP